MLPSPRPPPRMGGEETAGSRVDGPIRGNLDGAAGVPRVVPSLKGDVVMLPKLSTPSGERESSRHGLPSRSRR